ncbi:M3 family metallopeptidase [Burkholderia thailandensis]|uniref:oligopeptidase A n=1 Tax=Burkholderia thailandensis TaxID=57975 RepID=A0AAW9CRL6_BURTH|nr:M3 family metallopeptidase [Burkholderia thailandensis]AHI66917.1 peptidase M3 family protein [Burkholderia thailandensis H0587]AIP66296.1 oligopeptidase A [Burkholderia thailandensis]AOI54804.1 oligopeptidase A [Burkholderia thailandensis]AOJ53761.1 oligopeptidase A [Burkholderia thailandensis]AVR28099.1 M3 family peptidase [Burkholderia thailandensis]
MAPTTLVNPLLDRSQLPRFESIRDFHVSQAVDALLIDLDNAILRASAKNSPPNWVNVIEPISLALESLEYAWGTVTHLVSVCDSAPLRAAYGSCAGRVSAALSRFRQNAALLDRYRAVAESDGFCTLAPERRTVVRNLIRDARLAGSELPPGPRARLNVLRERIAQLATAYQDNIADATRAFARIVTDDAELDGIPDYARAAARAAAARRAAEGFEFTLDFASYQQVMQFSTCRALREEMYRARSTRASELGATYANGAAQWDNAPVMAEMLKLRHEEAGLLGYRDFAQMSLERKMARTPERACAFLENLHRRVSPKASLEWQALQSFARGELGLADVQPWDIAFATERMRQQCFGVSTEDVRRYFPEHAVLRGLFDLVETLFDIRIRPDEGSVWHDDVRLFRLEDLRGETVAHLYLDLYARDGKREGAWAASGRSRATGPDGSIRTPVAYLMCNVAAPAAGSPACFAFDQVVTLFHEMGHCLHHMLTGVAESAISGTNGVEWDAIEFPSQFMENFCWDPHVVSTLSAHVETGEPLPNTLFERMLAARHFNQGIEMAHQIALSMLDIALHSHQEIDSINSMQNTIHEIYQKYEFTPLDRQARSANTFSHIFSGGYAAAYYSYQWAQVLAADAYAAVEEARVERAEAGKREAGERYRTEVLEPGGSRPALESFIAFRGRAPSLDALLRHCRIDR